MRSFLSIQNHPYPYEIIGSFSFVHVLLTDNLIQTEMDRFGHSRSSWMLLGTFPLWLYRIECCLNCSSHSYRDRNSEAVPFFFRRVKSSMLTFPSVRESVSLGRTLNLVLNSPLAACNNKTDQLRWEFLPLENQSRWYRRNKTSPRQEHCMLCFSKSCIGSSFSVTAGYVCRRLFTIDATSFFSVWRVGELFLPCTVHICGKTSFLGEKNEGAAAMHNLPLSRRGRGSSGFL